MLFAIKWQRRYTTDKIKKLYYVMNISDDCLKQIHEIKSITKLKKKYKNLINWWEKRWKQDMFRTNIGSGLNSEEVILI
jgi:hypothetical protein